MKKIWSMLLILIVSIGGLFTATTFAEELPIIPSNSKTTITIEKSESIQKPLGTMKLKTSQAELDFVIHQKDYSISEYIFLEDEYGNHGQINRNDLLFSSSDTVRGQS